MVDVKHDSMSHEEDSTINEESPTSFKTYDTTKIEDTNE